MANTLQIKRGVWNTTGAPSSLSYGEIAWDNASEVLYIGKQTDAGGTITVTSLNNVVISDIPDATSSVKGLASFSTDNFDVTSGAVTIKDLGIATAEIQDAAITNGKIANNAVTLGTQTTGNYVATIADAGNTAITVANSGTESAAVTLDIANDGVALGTKTTGNYVATISGTTNEIEVSGSGSETASVTIGLPNDVTIGATYLCPIWTLLRIRILLLFLQQAHFITSRFDYLGMQHAALLSVEQSEHGSQSGLRACRNQLLFHMETVVRTQFKGPINAHRDIRHKRASRCHPLSNRGLFAFSHYRHA